MDIHSYPPNKMFQIVFNFYSEPVYLGVEQYVIKIYLIIFLTLNFPIAWFSISFNLSPYSYVSFFSICIHYIFLFFIIPFSRDSCITVFPCYTRPSLYHCIPLLH